MNISRFFGSTNREAMRQVRLALGPDALIVSNRRVNGGVEILAADPTLATSDEAELSAATVAPSAAAAEPADLLREMGAMRGALESRIDDLMWGHQMRQTSNAAVLFQTLMGCGFSTALLRAMLTHLPARLSLRAAQEWARSELVRNLPVLSNEDALWTTGRTLALVGPTGVGKTTTIAKLAARAVKRHGHQQVALLTTDTFRIGAYEQLKIYGDLLKVPVRSIQSAQELKQVLQLIPRHVTVLIDNVGVSQRDHHVAEQAAMLNTADRPVHRLLVLNAASHGETLDEVARRYASDGGSPLQGCIISKADEASGLAAALDTAIRYRLPVHYVSHGQQVPADLAWMSADALIEQATASDTGRTLYAPSAADFAALMSATAPDGADASRRAHAGVGQLLGTLLSGAHEAPAFEHHAFQAACDEVDEILPVAEAWDVWLAASGAAQPTGDATARHRDRMLRTVRMAGHGTDERPVLAVHGDARLGASSLRTAMLLDAAGQPLITPAQQLACAHGWWTSWGASAEVSPSSARALLMQAIDLQQRRAQWTMVHAFERAGPAIWNEAASLELNWLTRISTVARFIHDGSLATVSAIGKTLSHSAAGHAVLVPGAIGARAADTMLWAAMATVTPTRRAAGSGGSDAPLALISVKIAARRDGRILRHLFGVTNLDGAFTLPQVARWLVNVYEARAALRAAAQAMDGNQLANDPAGTVSRLVLAQQIALAAWALPQHDTQLTATVDRLTVASGDRLASTASGLVKLFAVKKWLADANETSHRPSGDVVRHAEAG